MVNLNFVVVIQHFIDTRRPMVHVFEVGVFLVILLELASQISQSASYLEKRAESCCAGDVAFRYNESSPNLESLVNINCCVSITWL